MSQRAVDFRSRQIAFPFSHFVAEVGHSPQSAHFFWVTDACVLTRPSLRGHNQLVPGRRRAFPREAVLEGQFEVPCLSCLSLAYASNRAEEKSK
jgi:hypothetical protein